MKTILALFMLTTPLIATELEDRFYADDEITELFIRTEILLQLVENLYYHLKLTQIGEINVPSNES